MPPLRSLLAPPVFDDPDLTAAALLLHPILLTLGFLLLIIISAIMLVAPAEGGRIALGGLPVLLGCLSLLWLERRGRVRLASGLLVTLSWLSLTTLTISGAGVHAPAFVGGYLTLIVVTGLLLGGRASVVVAALSMFLGLGLLVAEPGQVWSPAPDLPSRVVWIISSMFFWIVVAVQQLSARVRREALVKAQTELLERQRAEAAVQRSVAIYRQAIVAAGAVPYYRDYRLDTHAYTFMGEGILAITGYTAAELTPTLFDQIAQESVMRGSLGQLSYEEADRLSEAGQIRHWECDYRILTRDGLTRWVADSAVQVRDENDVRIGVVGILQDITERKQAEAALSASEERYRIISSISSDYVFYARANEDGWLHMQWVSGAFEAITGYTLEEHTALGGWPSLLHPDDVAKDARDMAALHDNRPVDTEVRIRRKTGETRWVHVSAQPVWDAGRQQLIGIYGAVQDITARKESDLARTRYADRLEILHEIDRAILAARSPEDTAIAALTRLRRLIPCVRASVNLFDFHKRISVLLALDTDLPTGLQVGDSLPLEDYGLEVIAHLQTGQPYFVEDITATRVDDRLAREGIQSWLIIPLHDQQELIGAVNLGALEIGHFTPEHAEIAQSIANPVAIMIQQNRLLETVRRANVDLEARVEARTEELRAANESLAKAARLKDEFLASMSHELRTPLTGILAFAQSLQKPKIYGELNEKQLKAARTIEDSGRHLLELINDILDLSKIEAGKLELQPEVMELDEIGQASLRLVKQMAAAKRQSVSYRQQPLHLRLVADSRRLTQMLVNLLGNAVKFTPEGGELGLEVVGDAAQQIVHLTVWDKGIGIAPENLSKLFQSFVQLDSRLAREYTGTGLGLALVRRMTEMHGGSVGLESELGHGSRFTITLPWRPTLTPTPLNPTAAFVFSPAGHWPERALTVETPSETVLPVSPHLLLAEDSEVNIQVLSDYLQASGYTLTVARNGFEAVRLAQTVKPHAILMDIQMPEMDGLEATRRIRQDPTLARVPIIALTALAMPGDRERCLAAGVNAYLTKPVSLEQLTENIQTLLKQ